MSATSEDRADFANIDRGFFGARADADFVFGKFLEKDGRLNAFDRAKVVDNAFIVLGQNLQALDFSQRKRKGGNAVVAMELSRIQSKSQKLKAAAGLAVVHGAR